MARKRYSDEDVLKLLREIDVHLHDGSAIFDVSTSEISTIILQGKGTRTVVRHGTSMTQTTLPFEKLMPSPWLRLTIVDGAGKRAWTNPVWRAC